MRICIYGAGAIGGFLGFKLAAIGRIFSDAGLKTVLRNIRDEIWLKLWGNLCFNPISALTTGTLEAIATDPGTRVLSLVQQRGRMAGCY